MRAFAQTAKKSSQAETNQRAHSRFKPAPLQAVNGYQEEDEVSRVSFTFGAMRALPAPATRTLQRKCACGGTCEKCKKLQRKAADPDHADHAGHRQEVEADRVAQDVMTHAQPAPIERLRAEANENTSDFTPQVETALNSPGQAMEPDLRRYFESRFGHDFGRVRVHVDDEAASSADAHAFTVGDHIVFAADHYRPATYAGKRLLAHELTHVVQQSNWGPRDTSPTLETEAQRTSHRVTRGLDADVAASTTRHALHREEAETGAVRVIAKENGKVAVVLIRDGKIVRGYAEITPPKGMTAQEAVPYIYAKETRGNGQIKVDVIVPPTWGQQATNPKAKVRVIDENVHQLEQKQELVKAKIQDMRDLYKQYLQDLDMPTPQFMAMRMSDDDVLGLVKDKGFFDWVQKRRAKEDWKNFQAQARALGAEDGETIKEMWKVYRADQLKAEQESLAHLRDLKYDTEKALQSNKGQPLLLEWIRRKPEPFEVDGPNGKTKVYHLPLPDGTYTDLTPAQFAKMRKAAFDIAETRLNTAQTQKDRYQYQQEHRGLGSRALDKAYGAKLEGKTWAGIDKSVQAGKDALKQGDLDAMLNNLEDAEKQGMIAKREFDKYTHAQEVGAEVTIQGLELVEKGSDIVLAVGTVPMGGWGLVLVTGKGVTQSVALAALKSGSEHVDWKDVGFDVGVQISTAVLSHGMGKVMALGKNSAFMNVVRESVGGQIATDALQAVILNAATDAAKQEYEAARGRREKYTAKEFLDHVTKFLTDPTGLPLEVVKAQAMRYATAKAMPLVEKMPLNRKEHKAMQEARKNDPGPQIEPPIQGQDPHPLARGEGHQQVAPQPPAPSAAASAPAADHPQAASAHPEGKSSVSVQVHDKPPEGTHDAPGKGPAGKGAATGEKIAQQEPVQHGDAPAASRPAAGEKPVPQEQATAIRKALAKDPKALKKVNDPDLKARGYTDEIIIDGKVFRRKGKKGTWCRWASPETCGMTLDPATEAAIAKAEAQHPLVQPEAPKETSHDKAWESAGNYAKAREYANKKLSEIEHLLAKDDNYKLWTPDKSKPGVRQVRRADGLGGSNKEVVKLTVDAEGVVRFGPHPDENKSAAKDYSPDHIQDPKERAYHARAEDETVKAMKSDHGDAMNANELHTAFPAVDVFSPNEVASTKAYDGPTKLERYVKDFFALCGGPDPAKGGPKIEQAAAMYKAAKAKWEAANPGKKLPVPAEFDADPAGYLATKGTLRIPQDQLGAVKAAIVKEITTGPGQEFAHENVGLPKGAHLSEKAARDFVDARVKSFGKNYSELFTPQEKAALDANLAAKSSEAAAITPAP